MADPYVYPGTNVLVNKENIRKAEELASFERIMTLDRMSQGIPNVPLTSEGYSRLHEHLFQDVYAWAGRPRTVDIAKGSSYFCRTAFIESSLEKQFEVIRDENGLRGLTPDQFAERAAEHISELNAIHPFREGNGRTLRAFLVVLGQQAGHLVDLKLIDAKAWNDASREGFLRADAGPMRGVIAGAVVSGDRQA